MKFISFHLIIIIIQIIYLKCFETSFQTGTKTMTKTSTKSKTKFKTHTKTKTNTKAKTKSLNKLGLKSSLSFKQLSFLKDPTSGEISSSEIQKKIINFDKDGVDNIVMKAWRGDMYWQGWIKYFKIEKSLKPSGFNKNFEFRNQKLKYPNLDLNEKEDGVYKFIRSENLFYLAVFHNHLNIAQSNIDKLRTSIDVLSIDLIVPVSESGNSRGGILDVGTFSEGYCFKVLYTKEVLNRTLIDSDSYRQYLLCLDSNEEKQNLMSTLKKLKVHRQRLEGKVYYKPEDTGVADQNSYLNQKLQMINSNFYLQRDSTDNSQDIDGKWVVIQDWSECSVKCGGGTSVMQRICIPPKGKGLSCQGEPIIKVPCNNLPCNIVNKLF